MIAVILRDDTFKQISVGIILKEENYIVRVFVSKVMEWPLPHVHVAEENMTVTQRVTHCQITILLAPLSSNDNITIITDGDTPHFGSTTTNITEAHTPSDSLVFVVLKGKTKVNTEKHMQTI